MRDRHSNKNDNSEKFHISPKKDVNGHSDSQINNDEPSSHSTTPSNNKNISQEDALPSEIRIKIPGEECKELLDTLVMEGIIYLQIGQILLPRN